MKLRTAIVTATTAAVLATSGVAIAGATGTSAPPPSAILTSPAPAAQSPAPPAHSPDPAAAARRFATGDRKARRLRIRRLVRGAGNVVAKAIGIDRLTLRKGLVSGQTIAEIATANHVEPQVVIDALANAAKTKLDAAVTAGKISSARAARISEKLPARIERLVNNWHPKRLRDHAPA